MKLPDPSPVLDKGPEILSSTGAGVWRKAPMAIPDSSSVLDKLQSASGIQKFLLRYAEGGDKTSQYSYLVAILLNWSPTTGFSSFRQKRGL